MKDTHTAVVLDVFAACSELAVGLFTAQSNFVNINFFATLNHLLDILIIFIHLYWY